MTKSHSQLENESEVRIVDIKGGGKIYWKQGRSAGIFRAQKKSTPRDFSKQNKSPPRDFFKQKNSVPRDFF